jgi:16S rRNA (guanine966-N2)-methyltransferase
MRIITGKYRGRRLKTPKNSAIRPTTDKIRSAVFNVLNSRGVIHNALVLDVFCGTGALGLEALSRGAAQCIFVDRTRESLALAQENARNFDVPPHQTHFILSKAESLPPRDQTFLAPTLVFCDPPYGKDLITPTLDHLKNTGWLAPAAFIVLETDKREDIKADEGFTIIDERIYGDTKITFTVFEGEGG